MRISELQTKDIVNINDGKRIGKIVDIEINNEGQIVYLIIESKKAIRAFISSSMPDSTITFNQIKKIGEDVILVDL